MGEFGCQTESQGEGDVSMPDDRHSDSVAGMPRLREI